MPGTVPPIIVAGLVVAAGITPVLTRALGRRAAYVLSVLFALGAGALSLGMPQVLAGETLRTGVPWVPGLGVQLSFVLDGLSMLFGLVILVVGALVMAYSARYLSPDEGHGRLLSLLTLFAAAMLGLVLAGDLIFLFVCWEITSITSFLLIGGAGGEKAGKAATRAFLVTAIGGLALLAGVILIAATAGTFDLSELLRDPAVVRESAMAPAIVVLVLLGAFTKSAQVPFQFWLPGAMVAPTPVSTYLHAATMVKAGIYLLARLSPVFEGRPEWLYPVMVTGLVTAVVGGILALKQHDLKALLAYSTISQLGLMTALVGAGTGPALSAAAVLIVAHAAYKATLFMVAGIVDHEAEARDIRELSGLRRPMPLLAATSGLGVLSMAGLPPLLGFVAKEEMFAAFLDGAGAAWFGVTATVLVVLASVLTFAYAARLWMGTFGGRLEQRELHEPQLSFEAPAMVTAVAGVALGLGAAVLTPLVDQFVADTVGASGPALALWHGFTPALGLSVLAILGGVGMVLASRRMDALLALASWPGGGAGLFDRELDEVTSLGRRVGQPFVRRAPGAHLAWILGAVAVAGLAGWWAGTGVGGPGAETPAAEWPVVLLLGVAVIAVARARNRLAAVALVGVSGFVVAVLYLLLGAPDLVLTQLLVEGLTVFLVVLVFRHLPRVFRRVSRARRLVAGGAALGLGILAALGTYAFMGHRAISEPGSYYLEAGPEDAGAGNVVNAILVDFRALDTLGEITVLAAAAIGVAIMARMRERPARQTSTTILRTTAGYLTPAIVALSAFFLLRGHDAPGGGFIAALVAGAAIVLRYLAGGMGWVRRLVPMSFEVMIGAGLGAALAVGVAALALGGAFLEGEVWRLDVPLLGQVKVAASLGFDVGVYLVVVGVVAAIVRSMREEAG